MPSAHGIAEAYREDRSTAWLYLLTITHPDIVDGPLRFVNERVNIVSNGHVFYSFPFDIVLPDDTTETTPKAQLKIDNVSRDIYEAVWGLSTSPMVQVDVIVADAPDMIEFTAGNLRLEQASADELYIIGDLAAIPLTNEPFPGDSFNPGDFVGLF